MLGTAAKSVSEVGRYRQQYLYQQGADGTYGIAAI